MFEIWDILRPLTKFCLYLAMFMAAGGVIFEVLFRRFVPEVTQRHVSRLIGIAAWAGLVLVGARLVVAAGSLGGDLASMTDPVLLGLVMKSPLGLSSVVAGIGLAMITVIGRVKARGEQAARIVAAATVLLSLTLVGHATTLGAVTGVLLALHLGGVAFWLGALLPLRQMCGGAGDADSMAMLADIADRFGRNAQRVVPVLIVAGVAYAAILTGSVAAMLTSGYGLALLVKIGLVAGLLGLAARNRFRIVPALQAGDLSAALRLRRTIDWEILVAMAVLVMSSLLTSSLTLPMRGME
ncbi:MAG: CopD family protein [Rhodobiaceae bacterium]